MQLKKGAESGSVAVTLPVTTIYPSLKSHKSFSNRLVVNPMSLFLL